jgi:hypothetical protein
MTVWLTAEQPCAEATEDRGAAVRARGRPAPLVECETHEATGTALPEAVNQRGPFAPLGVAAPDPSGFADLR